MSVPYAHKGAFFSLLSIITRYVPKKGWFPNEPLDFVFVVLGHFFSDAGRISRSCRSRDSTRALPRHCAEKRLARGTSPFRPRQQQDLAAAAAGLPQSVDPLLLEKYLIAYECALQPEGTLGYIHFSEPKLAIGSRLEPRNSGDLSIGSQWYSSTWYPYTYRIQQQCTTRPKQNDAETTS